MGYRLGEEEFCEIEVGKTYINVPLEIVDQQTQATSWVDRHYLADYEARYSLSYTL